MIYLYKNKTYLEILKHQWSIWSLTSIFPKYGRNATTISMSPTQNKHRLSKTNPQAKFGDRMTSGLEGKSGPFSPPRVVNGPTSSGPNPARTRKYKPEPENQFEAQIKPEKTRKLS